MVETSYTQDYVIDTDGSFLAEAEKQHGRLSAGRDLTERRVR